MLKLAVTAAALALSTMIPAAGPAAAAPAPDKPIVLAQDVEIHAGYRDRDDRFEGRDRDRVRIFRHEGCRNVTIRERHGDTVVVRHIHRCD